MRPCSREAVSDGYCKQHSPEATEARRAKSDSKWAKKLAGEKSRHLAHVSRFLDRFEAAAGPVTLKALRDQLEAERAAT